MANQIVITVAIKFGFPNGVEPLEGGQCPSLQLAKSALLWSEISDRMLAPPNAFPRLLIPSPVQRPKAANNSKGTHGPETPIHENYLIATMPIFSKKHRVWILACVFVCSVVVACLVYVFGYKPGKIQFTRIENGMNVDEVQSILGRPSGKFSGKPSQESGIIPHEVALSYYTWTFDDGFGDITFDAGGRVVHKAWTDRQRQKSLQFIKEFFSRMGI